MRGATIARWALPFPRVPGMQTISPPSPSLPMPLALEIAVVRMVVPAALCARAMLEARSAGAKLLPCGFLHLFVGICLAFHRAPMAAAGDLADRPWLRGIRASVRGRRMPPVSRATP